MLEKADANGWEPADYDLLLELAAVGHFEPEDLAAVLGTESEFRSVVAESGARGLPQLMPETLRGLGWRKSDPAFNEAHGEFAKAPVRVQLQYAAKYFGDWRYRFRLPRWENRGQMFLANFLPAELPHGRDPAWVVAGQGKRPLVVTQNRVMDRNRDGAINLAEVALYVEDAIRTRAREAFLTALIGIARARMRHAPWERDDEAPTSSAGPGLRLPEDIRAVQRALAELGYAPGPFDGLRGELTRRALVAFQNDRGLWPDAMVGPETWYALAVASMGP